MGYYIKTISTKTYIFVQQHYVVTVMISSLIHLNKRKKKTRCFKVRWNWYTQFHRLNFNPFFTSFITQVLAEVSYLVVSICWSFHGCRICCLRQGWKYYKNTNSKKVRTLLAGYIFIGFALLCFQTVTSHPLTRLFSIGWETKQLTCFPFKFALFNNHNSNKNNNMFSSTKFSKLTVNKSNVSKFKLPAV